MNSESYGVPHYVFSSSLMLLLPLRFKYFPQYPGVSPPLRQEYGMKFHIHKMQ